MRPTTASPAAAAAAAAAARSHPASAVTLRHALALLLLALLLLSPPPPVSGNSCPPLESILRDVPIPNQVYFDPTCLSTSSCFSTSCFNPVCLDPALCSNLSCLPSELINHSSSGSGSSRSSDACFRNANNLSCLSPRCLEGRCFHSDCINTTCLEQRCPAATSDESAEKKNGDAASAQAPAPAPAPVPAGCFPTSCIVQATENVTTGVSAASSCSKWPSTWRSYANVTFLSYSHLGLTDIPSGLCTLTNLENLLLGYNSISSIPNCLSSLPRLKSLQLQHNKISGQLPDFWGSLSNLETLYLNDNGFTGELPPSLLDASSLQVIKLSNNNLQGDLTTFLGNLSKLHSILDFSVDSNSAEASIPAALGSVSSLQVLNLANNKISQGVYPNCMASFPNLFYLNTTGNNAKNTVSCPPYKNTGSCCSMSKPVMTSTFCTLHCRSFCSKCNNPPLDKSVVVAIALCSAAVFAAILSISIWFLLKRLYFTKRLSEWEEALKHGAIQRFSLAEIEFFTSNFSRRNCIGKGGFGEVYRGVGPKGQKSAVKRGLKRQADGEEAGFFEKEVLEVSRLKHRNLIRLLGYCCEAKEQILVYELAANGSLDQHIYSEYRAFYLSFRQRLDVAIGTADGLAYLHHHLSPAIIHRDIKPGNILLDENLEAKVADFGLLKDVDDAQVSALTRVVGTMGYTDPDYFTNHRVKPRADVYSYGVVLLELVTGRAATTKSVEDPSLNVHISSWAVPRVRSGKIEDIADTRILTTENAQSLLEMAQIAIDCVSTSARERPNMMEVAAALRGLKRRVMLDAGEDVSQLESLRADSFSIESSPSYLYESSDYLPSSRFTSSASSYVRFSGPIAL